MNTIFSLALLSILVASSSGLLLTKCQTKTLIQNSGIWYGDSIRVLTCIAYKASNYNTGFYTTTSSDDRYGLFAISDGSVMNPPNYPRTSRFCYAGSPSGLCGTDCVNLESDDGYFSCLCAQTIYQAWNNTWSGFPAYNLNRVTCASFSISDCP